MTEAAEEGSEERKRARRELIACARASSSYERFLIRAPQRYVDAVSDADYAAIVAMFIGERRW